MPSSPSDAWHRLAARCGLSACLVSVLAGCLSPEIDSAQNRCIRYGFHAGNAMARCTEIEVNAPPPHPLGFGAINAAQDRCLVLGYHGDDLADCTQRHVRATLGLPG